MSRDIKYSKLSSADFPISYKAPWALKGFLDRHYALKSRYVTGASNKFQRYLEKQVKKARLLGLLPFVDHHSLID